MARGMSNKANPISPQHYQAHQSGVECIAITEHFNFCLGNAIKYIWRAGLKGDAVEDLQKAKWYIEREIARIEGSK
jgi:hypothetical protein